MKERPILFSAPMVRAILAGTKTQTRRAVKPQPERRNIEQVGSMLGFKKRGADGFWLWPNARERILAECPYGQPGDRLWVRETFQKFSDDGSILYKADPQGFEEMNELKRDECLEARWRPSIHMPRWASRITLEITGVRVERLQDISEADAVAEGLQILPASGRYVVEKCQQYFGLASHDPREVYRWLWEQINGPESWDANPWVWVIEFERIPSHSQRQGSEP